MKLTYILLLLFADTNPKSSSGWSSMIMLLLLVVVFWLFFIRPQSKKNREIQRFRQGLKKGDRIITIGGIHGKIIEISDTTAIIEVEGQGKLKIEKNAIAQEFRSEEVAQK
jgi:preprotein translocase subunit YajC